MEYRKMEEKDIGQIAEIEKRIFSRPWLRKDFFDSLQNPNHLYAVAEEQNKIFGYCGLWNVVGEGQITNVAVIEEARQKGIGYGMLSYLIDWGKEEKIQAYTLEVRESNIKAIRLYEKLGFRIEGIRKNFYDLPEENAIIMWK